MQVLKFGGTSVANAENITMVVAIVKRSIQKDKTVLVVSALGGITDILLSAATLASEGNETYNEKLAIIEQRHLEADIEELIHRRNPSMKSTTCQSITNEILTGFFSSPPNQ